MLSHSSQMKWCAAKRELAGRVHCAVSRRRLYESLDSFPNLNCFFRRQGDEPWISLSRLESVKVRWAQVIPPAVTRAVTPQQRGVPTNAFCGFKFEILSYSGFPLRLL